MSTFDDLLLEEKHVQEAAYESLRLELTVRLRGSVFLTALFLHRLCD